MENLLFIKSEIIIFIFSILYIFYYLGFKVYNLYFKVRNIVKPQTIKKRKTALNKVSLKKKKSSKKIDTNIHLSDKNILKLDDIIQKVKLNITKGYLDTSKNLIVEGLSIDKYNKELNLQLAKIYSIENKYSNAEYIYKDLLDNFKGDYEIMKKLGYNLAVQNKLVESLLIYELLHNKNKGDIAVIEILSDLSFTLDETKKALKYTNLFLGNKPRNIDKLTIKAICLEKLGKLDESIDVYKRILELQPYNTKARDSLNLVIKNKKELEK